MKKVKKQLEDHPFYSYKHYCRRTAWDTPEYLTEDDWTFLDKVIPLLSEESPKSLFKLLSKIKNADATKRFFNQTIGWPEGHVYCFEQSYFNLTGFKVLKTNHLPKLIEASEKHKKGKEE